MPTAARKAVSKIVPANRRALVVVGMHRSGTSAATRVLSLSGAGLPLGLMSAHPDNPAGFWESQSVVDLNDEILRALNSDWEDVFGFRLSGKIGTVDPNFHDRAVALLKHEFGGSNLIVLKDPRISLFIPFWERALHEAGYSPYFVVMIRNPLEVAESLRVRDGFSPGKSILLWSSYMIAAERDTRDRARTCVSYGQLMSNWRTVLRRIEDGAGLRFPRASAASAKDIERFLDHGLRHHQARPQEFFSRDDVTDDFKSLYRIFSDACEGVAIDRATVDAVEARLADAALLAGPALADVRERLSRLLKEVNELNLAHAGARRQADSLADFQQHFDAVEAEIEEALRVVESRTERSISEYEAERNSLAAEAEAERRRADGSGAELASERDQTLALRGGLAAAEAKLIQLEQTLEAVEDEIDEAIRNVELRVDRRIAASEDRVNQEVARREEVEALQAETAAAAESGRARAEELTAEMAAAAESNRVQVEALTAELAQVKGELAKIRASMSWRLTTPLRQSARWLRAHSG